MMELSRDLLTELRTVRVRIRVPDRQTAVFQRVPINARFFNKSHTNILVKRSRDELPLIVFVDRDLVYQGTDRDLAEIFAGTVGRDGWRVLICETDSGADLDSALTKALAVLGFDGAEPRMPEAETATDGDARQCLLDKFGRLISPDAADAPLSPCIGRRKELEEVASCLLRRLAPVVPVICGDSGVGKTNLLAGVARLLHEHGRLQTVRVDIAELFAGVIFDAQKENLLRRLLGEAETASDRVVALEHIDLVVTEAPHGALALAGAADRGCRLAGTVLTSRLSALLHPPLRRRLAVVTLIELAAATSVEVLRAHRPTVEQHHGVRIDDAVVGLVVRSARSLGRRLPAAALAVLDQAAASAALLGANQVTPDDVCAAVARMSRDCAAVPEAENRQPESRSGDGC